MKFNIDLSKIKKMALQRVAPFVLATAIMTSTASAANVSFNNTTISGETTSQSIYTSGYLTDNEAKNVQNLMNKIEQSYSEMYSVLANGGMNVGYNITRDNSKARLLASINEINNTYSYEVSKLTGASKTVVEKYLTSMANESKLLYASITSVPAEEVNDYAANNNCVFTNVSDNNNIKTVAVFKHNGGQGEYVYFDDSRLTTDKDLIKVPVLNVYGSGTNTTFSSTLKATIISKNSASMTNTIVKEAEALFDKIEVALNKGNYSDTNNFSIDDIYVSIYGDTNLVISSIKTKYASNQEALNNALEAIKARQTALVAKAYLKNPGSNYNNFVNYAYTNYSFRESEGNGYVYYNITPKNQAAYLYTVKDNGKLKTSDIIVGNQGPSIPSIPNQPSSLIPFTANGSIGMNTYFNDIPFFPTDVHGNNVPTILINGTTYLPARSVANIINADIIWDQATASVKITDKTSNEGESYYIDENGNKVYTNSNINYGTGNFSQGLKSVTISGHTGAKVYYNGVQIIPRDVNGREVPVRLINGTTYLPVRGITQYFNMPITYDGSTNSVFMGTHYTYNDPSVPNVPTGPGNDPGYTDPGYTDPGYTVPGPGNSFGIGGSYYTVVSIATGRTVRVWDMGNGTYYDEETKETIPSDKLFEYYDFPDATKRR